jgi:hypothetical protein
MKTLSTIILSVISLSASAACPNLSDLDILAWSYKAMMASYTFNFSNKSEQFKQAAAVYYNDTALKAYQTDFTKANYLEQAKKNKLIYSVGLSKGPLMLQKEISNQHLTWKIQAPLIIVSQSANKSSSNNKVVNLAVTQGDGCQLKITNFSAE